MPINDDIALTYYIALIGKDKNFRNFALAFPQLKNVMNAN